jgi:hypothetical protein
MISFRTITKILGIGIFTVLLFSVLKINVFAASISFSPSSGSFPVGCQRSVDIIVDATGQSSNAVDVEIHYNPGQITIIDSEPDISGIQVKAGNAYESLFYNFVDPATGTIKISAGSFVNKLTSLKSLATIEFTSSASATAAAFTIKFDGAGQTLDSNVADSQTSTDLLTSVSNASYGFVSGTCVSDTQSPTVEFVSPTPYQNGFTSGSNISFIISDNQSGVDISSLIITVNGTVYQVGDPGISYTGNSLRYTFNISYSGQIPTNQSSIIQVTGKDLTGNPFTSQIVFNIPQAIACPTSFAQSVQTPETQNNICSPSVSNFINSINTETIFKNSPLKNTIVDNTVKEIGVSGAGALLTGAALIVNIFPFLSILNAPSLILSIVGFFLGSKSKKTWGVILDSATRQPISLTICRLYQSGTLFLTSQTVSDLEGRYGFAIPSGNYRLEVVKEGYEVFKKEIRIGEHEEGYVYDVFLNKKDLSSSSTAGLLKNLRNKIVESYKKITPLMFVLGFILSIISIYSALNAFNITIFCIYMLIVFIFIVSKLNRSPRYSAVVDSQTNLRIPFAVIKFFDLKTRRLVDTQVSNNNGQFDFYGDEGNYAIYVAVRGYKFPSKKQEDYELIADQYNTMINVHLKKGRNKIKIFLDPLENSNSNIEGNLQTPFG